MQSFEVNYRINISDYRKACYYGLFLRYKKPLLIMFLVVIGGILYAIAGIYGVGKVNYLVLFIACAYLIWGLLLFIGAERNIQRYMRNPENLLNCTYHVIFDKSRIRISLPEKNINAGFAVSKLACAFELSAMFLIYPNTQETYIVPIRSMTEQQRKELRNHFRAILGNRFGSRFDSSPRKR